MIVSSKKNIVSIQVRRPRARHPLDQFAITSQQLGISFIQIYLEWKEQQTHTFLIQRKLYLQPRFILRYQVSFYR